jgi:hypothetical protein
MLTGENMSGKDTWKVLGSGSYNTAYVNNKKTLVFKVQLDSNDMTDLPERSVRLWNEINSHIDPKAELMNIQGLGNGWTCPYINGKQASDLEMGIGLIDIFNKTGRIVVDAAAPNNFIRTESGKIVCIDIGMALQLEEREKLQFVDTKLIRRNSITSLNTWQSLQDVYIPFFNKCSKLNLHVTSDTVKALLFIKQYRPDIFDVNFLKNDVIYSKNNVNSKASLVQLLALAYDKQLTRKNSPVAQEILQEFDKYVPQQPKFVELKKETKVIKDEPIIESKLDELDIVLTKHLESNQPVEVNLARKNLEQIRPINLDNIKESCCIEIDRYIKSRGKLTSSNKFNESLITKIFRDRQLTRKKVNRSIELKSQIKSAKTFEEIEDLLSNCLTKELTKSKHISGFETKIKDCLIIVANSKSNKSELDLSSEQLYNDTPSPKN